MRHCKAGNTQTGNDENACRHGCTVAKKLSKPYSGTCPDTKDIPRFLFAGQSNMEGATNDARNGLFDELFITLTGQGTQKQKIEQMENFLKLTGGSNPETSIREARLMYKLRKYVKKNNFNTASYKKAVCSLTIPNEMSNLSCEQNVSPTACGKRGFGPELMFSHVFPRKKSPLKKKNIGIIKIASGATEIYKNWMKVNHGMEKNYWQHLVDGIAASNGTIEAFVWFQGESDSRSKWNKENYLDHLTTFVADVRNEIVKSHTKFQTPSDVPVVIVELGNWVYLTYDPVDHAVINAQRAFVQNTKNTIIVNTGVNDDVNLRLTRFYHYNAAAMMIIGDRIARRLAKLLREQ